MTNDPVLIAYAVKRNEKSGRPIWIRCGRAYPHEVGAGLTVILDAVPFDGRIVLLELDAGDDEHLLNRLSRQSAKPRTSRS